MTSKSDWEAAYRELLEEGRQRLGEPPSVEDLLAFSRGRLPEAEAARVREFLSYNPEMARALLEPLPFPEEIRPGDPAFLSEEELEQDRQAIQAGLAQPVDAGSAVPENTRPRRRTAELGDRRSLQRWRRSTVAAALLAAVLGGSLVWTQSEVQRLRRELETPRTDVDRRQLVPDGDRDAVGGQEPIALRSEADSFLLVPLLIDPPSAPEVRLRILQGEGKTAKEVWSASGLLRDGADLEILVPRAFLRSGDPYRIELRGVRAGQEELLETYTIQLEEP
ncbi:MAG TPA: hypothetical protein VE685_04725 [Thermoanaerobaculia bacterium]|nr:hypothetical protein [Thermoanaerobaculia bacterium]